MERPLCLCRPATSSRLQFGPLNDAGDPYAAKSRECLAGAASELANGRYNNAANRAYYAAYNAAIIALLRAGLTSRNNRWDHDEVRARFAGELINRRKLYPAEMRSLLYDLGNARAEADYGTRSISAVRTERNLRYATTFVSAILDV